MAGCSCLCGVLLVWQPLSFGLVASSSLDALTVRGVPLAVVLVVRLIVTAFGIAAGLGARQPAAERRRVGEGCAGGDRGNGRLRLHDAVRTEQPHARETPIYIAVSVAWSAGWFLYLVRSRRVENTY